MHFESLCVQVRISRWSSRTHTLEMPSKGKQKREAAIHSWLKAYVSFPHFLEANAERESEFNELRETLKFPSGPQWLTWVP
jgi:hypothetical protein